MPGGNNPQNLAPPFRSGEEAREMGRAGGKASGVARRQKRICTEIARKLAKRKVVDQEILDDLTALGLVTVTKAGKPGKCTLLDAAFGGQFKGAMNGDPKCFRNLVELIDPGAYDPKYSRDADEDEDMTGVVELGAVIERERSPEDPLAEDGTDT